MKPPTITTACTYGILALAGASSLLLPESLTVSRTYAYSSSASYDIFCVVRDFQGSHPDFDVVPDLGLGHYAGNIDTTLDSYNRPVFTGPDSGGGAVVAPPAVVTGSYVGNNDDDRAITGVGFQPDFVIIKGDDGEPPVCRTSTMSGDRSKEMNDDTSVMSDRIQSLDADGFTIGSNDDVNDSGKTFYWMAFEARAGEMAVGTYNGNGNDDRAITGVGFEPDVVFTFPESAQFPYFRTSAMPAGRSIRFEDDSVETNRIQDLQSDGFEVGDSDKVNGPANRYHYVAWKAIAGQVSVGTYQGNGSDDRGITGAGFQPAYAIVKVDHDDYNGMHRTAEIGSVDDCLRFGDSSNTSNGIQAFTPDGFQVGSHNDVNRNNEDVFWMAWSGGGAAPAAPTGGFKVTTQWTDSAARPMAPHMEGYGGNELFTEFTMTGQTVVPQQDFAVMVTCLGAQIYTSSGNYHRPVTAKIRVGGQEFEPFGPYAQPVEANVNDDQSATGNQNPGSNPRRVILPGSFSAGDAVSVVGKSWTKTSSSNSGLQNSHWTLRYDADSAAGSTRIIMLRDGDDVPSYAPLQNQASITAFLEDFIDLTTGKMTMCDNQVIFLFELGASSSGSGDFQDLVLLVDLADSTTQLPPAPGCGGVAMDSCGNPVVDVAGVRGASSAGGITSPASFDEWYRDVAGVNASTMHLLTMTDDGSGVYEYLSNAFYPIDDELLGNEGETNNNLFTLSFAADFVYSSCGSQFIEFEGDDDAWMFLDGELVMDLGGVRPGTEQLLFLDRMDLVDGEAYTVHFFYAHRASGGSAFNLRTNVEFLRGDNIPAISAQFD